MQYDDGTDTQPGEELSVGDQVVGQATYDIDGDGVADSYIMVSGSDQVEVLTDSDGDGQVDTVYEIDGDGSVTEMQPQDGHLVDVGTGHLGADGRIAMDGTGTGHGGDGGDGGTSTGDGGPGTAGHDAGDMTMQDGGHMVDVGAPTEDLTGDGVNDTVVLHGTDGSTVLVADTDQDGQADTIAQINSDGSVVFAAPDGHGGWVVAGHGHVDASGAITQDQGGQTGQPYQPPVDLAHGQTTGTDAGTDSGTGTSTGSHTPGTGADPGTSSGSDSGTGSGHGSGSGEDITVDINGKSYDVGAATVDADGNGTPDTAVVHGDDGTTILVTDVNGDGTGDQIVQVNPDGTAVIQQTDGSGGWQTVATGHLDANGNLVVDQQ